MHDVLIAGHAVTATVALAAAFQAHGRAGSRSTTAALVSMLVLLVGAIAVDIPDREAPELVLDTLLVGLGLVMVAHTEGARRVRRVDRRRFVERLGFSAVGLVDAFVVVTVFDAGAPGWLAALLGAALAIAGHLAIRAAAEVTRPTSLAQ